MTRVLQSHSICQEHIPFLTAFFPTLFFPSPSHYTSLPCQGKLQSFTLCYTVPLLNEFETSALHEPHFKGIIKETLCVTSIQSELFRYLQRNNC